MASVRLPKGWACRVRCHHCHCVWKAELSVADKLIVAADAVAPVRRAMAAAQALLGNAAWSPALDGAHSGAHGLAVDGIEAALTEVQAVRIGRADAAAYKGTGVALRSAITSLLGRYEEARARNSWRGPLSRAQIFLIGLLMIDALIIGFRAELIWLMPQTASFYSAVGLPMDPYGLRFDDVSAVAERRDANPVLVVNGKIKNGRARSEAVPNLRFVIRDAGHQEIYSWSAAPAHEKLAPRETIQFRSELAWPPADTRDVVVRFDQGL
jgi:hypothetical protein